MNIKIKAIITIIISLVMYAAYYLNLYYVHVPSDEKIVIMKGFDIGIGNQLFKYAAAKSLATRLNAELWIVQRNNPKDITAASRNFSLDEFEINQDKFISSKQFLYIKKFKKVFKFNEENFFTTTRDDGNIFIMDGDRNKIKNTPDLTRFESEKFFKDIKDQITNLTFKAPIANKKLLNSINNYKSIAVHIRRGDFISEKRLIPITYQVKAMQNILTIHPDAHFFIFSDDVSFVRSAFSNLKNVTIASDENTRSIEELQLMSKCKHIIIANSTFSWWAAYLNKNPNKIVIAPNYFADPIIENDYLESFYKIEWIKIDPFAII